MTYFRGGRVGMMDTTSRTQTAALQSGAENRRSEVRNAWRLGCILSGVAPETTTPTSDRRGAVRTDRRKHSRSGRRSNDPRVNWRRWAWLFGIYALVMSVRSLPSTVRRKLFERSNAVPS